VGLALWWLSTLGWCATTWRGQGGGRPKEEEGEEKGREMVLVKVIELDFEGAVKRKVIEMMMMIMLEVEILVMGVVLWW